MSAAKHTPGPWFVDGVRFVRQEPAPRHVICRLPTTRNEGDARLIAAAPDLHAEMLRYLPVLERAEADPDLWSRLTDGLGIATLNGYRAAIAKATGGGNV